MGKKRIDPAGMKQLIAEWKRVKKGADIKKASKTLGVFGKSTASLGSKLKVFMTTINKEYVDLEKLARLYEQYQDVDDNSKEGKLKAAIEKKMEAQLNICEKAPAPVLKAIAAIRKEHAAKLKDRANSEAKNFLDELEEAIENWYRVF